MVMASNITFHVVRPEKGLIIPFSGPLSLSFPYMLFSTATMKLESNSITFFTLFFEREQNIVVFACLFEN